MAKQLQIRRGNTEQNDNFTGALCELTVNTDNWGLRIHDGETKGGHDLRRMLIDLAFPIGSWLFTDDPTNPAEIYEGTEWVQLKGRRSLVAADEEHKAGETGGSTKLTVDMLPPHTHSGSTTEAGGHRHNRGNMNITGSFSGRNFGHNATISADGAFWGENSGDQGADGKHGGIRFRFSADRTWSGETSTNGAHTHNVTVGETGGGQEAMDPWYATYIWKRVK